MSRGLSPRQRQALALLVACKRSLDVTSELLPALGEKPTDSTRRSLLRAVRLLRDRGLVTLERVPSERGGWSRLLVAAQPHAEGELVGGELQRARGQLPKTIKTPARGAKGTQRQSRQPRGAAGKTRSEPTCELCGERKATHSIFASFPDLTRERIERNPHDPRYCLPCAKKDLATREARWAELAAETEAREH